jgi:hypothetical protein
LKGNLNASCGERRTWRTWNREEDGTHPVVNPDEKLISLDHALKRRSSLAAIPSTLTPIQSGKTYSPESANLLGPLLTINRNFP